MLASALSFRIAVVSVLIGMVMGLGMAASENHALMPAHAHLNLLGWVSLFLFGIYFERRPSLDASRTARGVVIAWTLGTAVLTVAVAAVHSGYGAAGPVAGLASLILIATILVFGSMIFKRETDHRPSSARIRPAE
jgi:peptidoglycan/LPS O-acetylase OafA/YrhL